MDHYDQTEPYYKGRICLNHTASKNNSCQIKMHKFFHRNYTRNKQNFNHKSFSENNVGRENHLPYMENNYHAKQQH